MLKERETETQEAPTESRDASFELAPSAVGGAFAGAALVGTILGPVGAVAGFIAGAAAGQLYERSRDTSTSIHAGK